VQKITNINNYSTTSPQQFDKSTSSRQQIEVVESGPYYSRHWRIVFLGQTKGGAGIVRAAMWIGSGVESAAGGEGGQQSGVADKAEIDVAITT